MNLRLIIIFFLTIICVPQLALAETVLRAGNNLTVSADQVVGGDYYVSVGFSNTTMSGLVEGDMYALGGNVTVNGVVNEDVAILAGVSQLHASVTDDVRMLAGDTVVAESIGGDLFVIGNTLKVLSSAKIDGNVFFFGSDATIEGVVGGSIFGTANRMRVDGEVGKDIDVKVLHGLTLGSKAVIEGNVSYESPFSLIRAPEAVVEGKIAEKAPETPSQQEIFRTILIPVFVSLFATLSIYLLFRQELTTLVANLGNRYPRYSLIGLSVILAAPIVSILLMVTVLGFLLGAVLLAATAFLLLCGYALSSVVCGAFIARMMNAKEAVSLVWIITGASFLGIVILVPIIGPIIFVAIYSVSVGVLAERVYRNFQ